ncbi:sigma-54 interaction domain-containing protein [Psychrobacillus antarcticus]|uniref:sigma-54 interaction domain-containing protein n=1 Tax=Psychrobacillus antarcticus TaxID=2879115 RepID=UPI00240807DC|nr:sigma 54-interacting transcriptional regulator [Psychrobacillus antarcticus]
MYLLDIQSDVQSIAEAIAAVLDLEVEIADINYMRIAGTGEGKINILKKLEGNLVYKEVFETKKSIIIRKPGFEKICKSCGFYGNCMEAGEISAPIFMNNQIIGFIGLLAFSEEQRERLFIDIEGILLFLSKLADLLASKLEQGRILEEMKSQAEKLDQVINLMDQGVLIVTKYLKVLQANEHARRTLNLNGLDELPSSVEKWIRRIIELDKIENEPFIIQTRPRETKVIVNKRYINNEEFLISIQDVDTIQTIAENVQLEKRKVFRSIIGSSPQLEVVKEFALRAAQSKSTILLQGESGTGKEVFAKAIHHASDRNRDSFIAVNCGAIPDNLLESELFGYEKGAFTGASKLGKVGKFETANGGTIFLDEIGEMPLALQVKILRVLQENEIERVGGTSPIKVNVRVIAATNRALDKMIEEGSFREDLYYRLNVIPILIPPLRNRPEDIFTLCDYYIKEFNVLFNKSIKGFDDKITQKIYEYPWPGNVRELKNFIEYLFNFVREDFVTWDSAKDLIKRKLNSESFVIIKEKQQKVFQLDLIEKETIQKTMEYIKLNQLNMDEAAKLLGIGRATLFRKIKKYQIDI